MKPNLSTCLPTKPISGAKLRVVADRRRPSVRPLYSKDDSYVGRFTAMGSPCEVLMRYCGPGDAQHCLDLVCEEVFRIERKFSRYRDDNIVASINRSNGQPVKVDTETARLLDTANRLYLISNGLFDITSGCLRSAWVFDGSDCLPKTSVIDGLLQYVGWDRVIWSDSHITLPSNFEIDFGGIGKEYATDCCLTLAVQSGVTDVLINLGGDVAAVCNQPEIEPWRVGVECACSPAEHDATITIGVGGIATSGDTNKYLIKDGVRYSHVLDPRTGWSVHGAPQSVTVAASSCSEAGMYSTLAMLQGADAEQFLIESGVKHWVQRH